MRAGNSHAERGYSIAELGTSFATIRDEPCDDAWGALRVLRRARAPIEMKGTPVVRPVRKARELIESARLPVSPPREVRCTSNGRWDDEVHPSMVGPGIGNRRRGL